jgi:hypothetical protein
MGERKRWGINIRRKLSQLNCHVPLQLFLFLNKTVSSCVLLPWHIWQTLGVTWLQLFWPSTRLPSSCGNGKVESTQYGQLQAVINTGELFLSFTAIGRNTFTASVVLFFTCYKKRSVKPISSCPSCLQLFSLIIMLLRVIHWPSYIKRKMILLL